MEEQIRHTRLPFQCGAGEASVNIRTGRMIFTHTDFKAADGALGLPVTHVFRPEALCSGKALGMGNGWKLNFQQFIIPDAGNGGSDTDKFVYLDETGYSHRFERIHSTCQYYGADGTGLTMQVLDAQSPDYNGCRYVLFAESGKVMRFDANGRLIRVISEGNPQAEVNIGYEADKPIELAFGTDRSKILRLEYKGGRLSGMVYEETAPEAVCIRTFCYGYDSEGNLSAIIQKTVDSESNAEKFETVACFAYDLNKDIGVPPRSLYPLTKAVDGGGNSALQIDYDDSTDEGVFRIRKVSKGVCSVAAENTSSDPYGYAYGDGGEIIYPAEGCPIFLIGEMCGSGTEAWTEFFPRIEAAESGSGGCVVTVKDHTGVITDYTFDESGFVCDATERNRGN